MVGHLVRDRLHFGADRKCHILADTGDLVGELAELRGGVGAALTRSPPGFDGHGLLADRDQLILAFLEGVSQRLESRDPFTIFG